MKPLLASLQSVILQPATKVHLQSHSPRLPPSTAALLFLMNVSRDTDYLQRKYPGNQMIKVLINSLNKVPVGCSQLWLGVAQKPAGDKRQNISMWHRKQERRWVWPAELSQGLCSEPPISRYLSAYLIIIALEYSNGLNGSVSYELFTLSSRTPEMCESNKERGLPSSEESSWGTDWPGKPPKS